MGRPPTLSEAQVLKKLGKAFRMSGFEGTSLARLSADKGLAKAALYHRFPLGKEAMASTVLDQAEARMAELVLRPLAGPGTPIERLEAMADGLADFYERG